MILLDTIMCILNKKLLLCHVIISLLYREDIKSEMMQKNLRASSPEPSCVSLKSDRSMPTHPEFSAEPVSSDTV